jgi:hypothetical protein
MQPRRRFAIVAVTALAAAGTGAAIAATGDDRGKEAEDAILTDAAEQLDVEPDELRSALSDAELAQIDKAVEDGLLSEEQAEQIKERMQESGRVLGFPGGPPGGPHGFDGRDGPHGLVGPGPGGPEVFDAIAEELGIPVERLHRQLMRGKSMSQIARANGKSVADVKAAAKAAIESRLEEEVEEGDLTEEQADEIRDHLPEMLQHLVRGPRFEGRPGFGPPPGAGFGRS